jgi:hypothetical protein
LEKLKEVLPQIELAFHQQLDMLIEDRQLGPVIKAIVTGHAEDLALDEVKSLFPEVRQGVSLDLNRDMTRLRRALSVELTDNSRPDSRPAAEAISHFERSIQSEVARIAGVATRQVVSV